MDSEQTQVEGIAEAASPEEGKPNRSLEIKVIVLCAILVVSLIIGWSPLNQLTALPFNTPLTKKMEEVALVMGTTVAVGVAIDAIPVDSGKQVAGKLFDVAGYFMVVLGALVAMKILLTFSLTFSFGLIIPIACLLGVISLLGGSVTVKDLAIKLAIFAAVFAIAIPASVLISLAIDSSFEAERTQLLEQVTQDIEDINAANSEIQSASTESEKLDENPSSGGFLDGVGDFFNSLGDNVSDVVSGIGETVFGAVNRALDTATKNLENLMLLAVQWIVTGCVIPIVTIIGFGFVIKILFGFNLTPRLGAAKRSKDSAQ